MQSISASDQHVLYMLLLEETYDEEAEMDSEEWEQRLLVIEVRCLVDGENLQDRT